MAYRYETWLNLVGIRLHKLNGYEFFIDDLIDNVEMTDLWADGMTPTEGAAVVLYENGYHEADRYLPEGWAD